MNPICGWLGLVGVAVPVLKAVFHAFHLDQFSAILDALPDAIPAVCGTAGAGLLAVSNPLHKKS